MPVPDLLIDGVCYAITALTGGISIGCLIARDRMAGQRDEARSKLTDARQELTRWKSALDQCEDDLTAARVDLTTSKARAAVREVSVFHEGGH